MCSVGMFQCLSNLISSFCPPPHTHTHSTLHSRLRTATLRHDEEGQAVLLNLLLRNFLHYNLYDQADKLIAKSKFPEAASNNEWTRYLYYTGRIRAIQLEYSEAFAKLIQAIRKAPQNSAIGFKQTVSVSWRGWGTDGRTCAVL